MQRDDIFPETELPRGSDLLSQGAALAGTWMVGRCAFLQHYGVKSEFDYKCQSMDEGRIMQHAQVGFRDVDKSRTAYSEIWERCDKRGVRVDRYGLCLDWSMAVPRDQRAKATKGTGMILTDPETCIALTSSAPVAPHFGDFVLGFPAALENTQMVLAAGCTSIGNFGQYFTFKVPNWDDDVETTKATVEALGLIVAQPVPILVHSNIDDGFAAQFTDLTSSLGMMEIEKYIIENLIGGKMSHCFGHHFSDPLARLAFQSAMGSLTDTPGTMIYGNTTAYRGTPAENYASLARYLSIDALGQALKPTGHAINAVPVTENERIPDIEEIVDAQLFSGRTIELHKSLVPLIDLDEVGKITNQLVAGAKQFSGNVMKGLMNAGVDTSDAFEMMLSLRRIGARKLELLYGVGKEDNSQIGGRKPVVAGSVLEEISEMADAAMEGSSGRSANAVRTKKLKVLVATTDVHEHGKLLIEELLRRVGVEIIDGGVSTDPDKLAECANLERPDAIAVSTYNGVALSYYTKTKASMAEFGLDIPLLIGGRLNQIPEGSNTSLPVDVGDELAQEGAIVCRDAAELLSRLEAVC